MLSSRLIRMIESHGEQIAAETIQRVRKDSELSHLKVVSDSEMRAGVRHVLKDLGGALAGNDDLKLAARCQELGKRRFDEGIPLDEIVRSNQKLKSVIVGFVRNEGSRQTTLEIYAEEELEHLLYRYFDKVLYHVVRGYERARHVAELAAQ